MPRHSVPQQPSWLRPRLVVAFVVAAAGLVTAVWLPTRNDSADAAERRSNDSRERNRALPAFADEFSGRRGSTVDPAKWALRTDRLDNGVQFSESVRNARLDGEGNLVIVLRGEDEGFSTARLYTRAALRGSSGHIEARIKAPAGRGLRPTFELVDAERPADGALDLIADPVTDGGFHTYAVDWKPGEVVLSVDGERIDQELPAGLDTERRFRVALTLTVDEDRVQADLPARMVVDSVGFAAAGASAEPTAPTTAPTTEPTPAPPTEAPATVPPTEAPTSPPETAPTTVPPTTPPTTAPTATPPPSPAPETAAWAPFTDYVAGSLVSFKSVEYQVLETHTSLPGWEPTSLPALFKKI